MDDLDAALDFYVGVLGLELAMRDGDRFAMVRAGGVKLALATSSERSADAGIALGFKVSSLDGVAAQITAAGRSAPDAVEGAHERMLEIEDPGGHVIIFYAPS